MRLIVIPVVEIYNMKYFNRLHVEIVSAALKKESGKRKVFFRDLSGLFYLLALIRSGLPQQLQTVVELGEWVVKQRNHPQQLVVWMLTQYAEVKLGKNRAKQDFMALLRDAGE